MTLFGKNKKEHDDGSSSSCGPSLVYTLEVEGRRWKNIDVCGLVEALNALATSRSSGVLLDAISPAVWSERREAFSQKGLAHVISNLSSLPMEISSDVISVMTATSMNGTMRMEILETVVPGGANQLAEELSSRLGFPIYLEASKTEDDAISAFEKTSRLRRIIDMVFDAVLIVTGVCSIFALLAQYSAPGVIFVLAALMRVSMMKSVSSPFIAMPEGKLSASFLLMMYETENFPMEDRQTSAAKYVWLLSRREPSVAIIMVSLLGISLLLFLAAAPSVFQVLFSDGGTVSSLLFPQTTTTGTSTF